MVITKNIVPLHIMPKKLDIEDNTNSLVELVASLLTQLRHWYFTQHPRSLVRFTHSPASFQSASRLYYCSAL